MSLTLFCNGKLLFNLQGPTRSLEAFIDVDLNRRHGVMMVLTVRGSFGGEFELNACAVEK